MTTKKARSKTKNLWDDETSESRISFRAPGSSQSFAHAHFAFETNHCSSKSLHDAVDFERRFRMHNRSLNTSPAISRGGGIYAAQERHIKKENRPMRSNDFLLFLY